MLLVKRRFKLTIYPKIVFVFLLVIVPLCTLSLFINQKGKESVREELSKQMEASVQKFMDSFSTEIDRMSKHQREFIDDKDLQSISFGGSVLDSYEMTQRILKIQEKLSMIQISSALISKVSAYIPTINRVISSQNIIADLPADEYGMVVKASATGGAAIVEWQSRLFIVLSYPYYGFYDKEPSYALSIELNVDTIRHELSQFSTYGNGGAILWNRNQNWSLASGTDDTLNKAIQASYEPPESKLGVYPYHYDNDRYLISYRTGAEKDLSLAVYVPEEEVLGKLSAYGSWFWMLSIISIVVIFIFSAWIYRVIHRPMSHLVHSLRKVEKGVLEKMPVTRRGDEFSYLYTQFNSMVDQLKVLIHVVYEQKIRSQSSELKQLQSQINPHFLYNTYFTLYRLAKMHDIDKVILFCEHLGEYFQYITRGAAEQVPMTMELGHAKSYTDIQGIRFSSRIEVEFDPLPEDVADLPVPRLFLQPVLENAYNHGLEHVVRNGKIAVSFKADEASFIIRVEDSGRAPDDAGMEELRRKLRVRDDQMETTGLINVHRRIQLVFGQESGITLERSALGGLKVTILIMRGPKKS